MASVVMNMKGCDLAHAASCASPERHSPGKDAVAKPGKPVRSGSRHQIAAASAQEEPIDRRTVLSSAFPKCP